MSGGGRLTSSRAGVAHFGLATRRAVRRLLDSRDAGKIQLVRRRISPVPGGATGKLEDAFVKRYELKLILPTICTLNYDFGDEEEFSEDQRKKVRNLLCAVADSLTLAAKSELEIEARLKIEDGGHDTAIVAAEICRRLLASRRQPPSAPSSVWPFAPRGPYRGGLFVSAGKKRRAPRGTRPNRRPDAFT